jgi:ribose 5-phosphate isomerase A
VTDIDTLKQQAAEKALGYATSGMVLGLGSGSTALIMVKHLAEMINAGALKSITGVPTSRVTEHEAGQLGIPLVSLDDSPKVDLTIDGADEVDPYCNLIKGGGGALLREKIVAQASRRLIIIVDQGKLSPALGTNWPLPVEVIPFGWPSQAEFISTLGGIPSLRLEDRQQPFTTDQGNYILDCRFGPMTNPEEIESRLNGRAGIVEHGLFLNMADVVISAGPDGVRTLEAPHHNNP